MYILLNNNHIQKYLLALLFTVIAYCAPAQKATYLTKHKSIAMELSEQFGIPPQVILAVAMVESCSGEGLVAKKLNNHFGIVGKNKMDPKTDGYKSRYKQYVSVKESYLDFCKLVSHKRFYDDLKDSTDCKAWVKAISATGYSTKPVQWEQKVLKTIASNKL